MDDRLDGFATFTDFATVADPALYRPLPDGWWLGLTDVVRSTDAVGAGRYKTVNVAGSSAIAGIVNALRTRHFPFAFGGDGCVFALPARDEASARAVLAATAAWVRDDLDLDLRVAMVPVAALREAGTDVRVALYRPSQHVSYAMFDGGGVAAAEALMKGGAYRVEPAGPGVRPDLTGLSCRWLPIAARHGAIVSVVVRPADKGDGAFHDGVRRVLASVAGRDVHPVPPEGPQLALWSPGLRLETLARHGRAPWWRLLGVAAHHLMGVSLFRLNRKVGRFDPSRYRTLTGLNADTRKFGDALLLTVDCDDATETALRNELDAGEAAGAFVYGLHRQDAALMTCVVPSYQDDEHFHFIDGAGGGYTAATHALRAKAGAPA